MKNVSGIYPELSTRTIGLKELEQLASVTNRVPTVREKSVKNAKNSRSGKSQGILIWVMEI